MLNFRFEDFASSYCLFCSLTLNHRIKSISPVRWCGPSLPGTNGIQILACVVLGTENNRVIVKKSSPKNQSADCRLACVASVPVPKKSSQTIFRKAARKLGRDIEGTLARRPPIFEKPVRPRTGASDWCGIVTMIDR